MIKKLAQFLFVIPLAISILASGYVQSETPANTPPTPIEDLKEDANDCIKEIRKKQQRIRKEIDLIKDLIKQRGQNQNPQNLPEKDAP